MNKLCSFILAGAFILAGCNDSKNKNPSSFADRNIDFAAGQYKVMMHQLPDGRFPRSFENGKLITSDSGWWCSGFYPGTLLYLYEKTNDKALLTEANRMLELLKKEQYNTGTHDLGFMMFNSFGNANRLNPKPEYEEILINSAKSLASRYSPTIKSIRSWDSDPGDFLVIIDNMINLELLFWATKATGDSTFYNIATTHANSTIKNHFRDDYSSYHVVNYDPETGEVKEKRTAQGLNDGSAWARGQVWGLYGFTATYRETGIQKYLEQAIHIADFLVNHPKLPADQIPLWDFDADKNDLRDASAAAIMASALLELEKYAPQKRYKNTAVTIIENLAENYTSEPGENGGFILEHGVGHLPANSEADVPLTYADYYFVEALLRLDN